VVCILAARQENAAVEIKFQGNIKMTTRIIDGKAIAQQVREEWKARAAILKEKGILPGLAVIIVGDNPVSKIYVRNKIMACHDVGLHSEVHELPGDISEELLLTTIRRLNDNSDIHGILVQLPLPDHFNKDRVLEAISVAKDVDGLHLYNIGGLVVGNTVFPPCTPYGVLCLLEHMDIPIEGQNAVIVGRSNIVGKPMAMMLLQKNATVSICTSKTQNLRQFTQLADILVVATGKPHLITADMVKEGVAVIDVGINRLDDGRLVGDVDFESVKEKAGYITPVPGGVGPMTITMLVANTISAAERLSGLT
jgi:methylenetetrahydrofolate dehydrogenase (NADP+) / methenyltetrahydrofolate cyclohydrolase